jgi:serine protease Do
MFAKVTDFKKNRKFRTTTLAVIAVFFLIGGFIAASGLDLTGSTRAEAVLEGSGGQHLTEPLMGPLTFAELAKNLSPTVVNVKVTKVEKATFHGPMFPEGPFGDFFERYFGDRSQVPHEQRVQGAGSGVIFDKEGYILTNNHVVEGAKEVTVTLADKQEFEARIVGRDPKTDLAVLKIDSKKPFPSAPMGDSEMLKVGEWVLAVGNPFGLNHTVTSGIVSAKGRVIGAGPYDDFIQTDASINPGNSGGPLFNMKGEIVGINTAIVPYGQGIGFAIPVNTAKPLIPQLVSKGSVTRGYLGVNIQPVTPELATAMKLDDTKGALVGDVIPGGPAEKAGIKHGDVIVAFGDKAVESSHDLPTIVAATPVGKEINVKILRRAQMKELRVKVGKLPQEGDNMANSKEEPAEDKLGLSLKDMTPQIAHQMGLKGEHGVLVVNVLPGSPAEKSGIRRGDVIREVNDEEVTTVSEALRAIGKAGQDDPILFRVQRDQGSFFVAMAK